MLSNAENFPLLAEEGWTLQLIEAGAPGAKREPDRAKPQLMVSSAETFRRPDHPVCAASPLAVGASTPPLRAGVYGPSLWRSIPESSALSRSGFAEHQV